MSTTKIIQLALVLFIAASFFTTSFTQTWTSEQEEAWKTVEKMYELWAQRDLDGFLSLYHTNFTGWYGVDPLPLDKVSLKKFESHWLSTTKIHLNEIKPVSIRISDNVVVIHLYSTTIIENEKEKKLKFLKWTVILKKENGKWLILGEYGGRLPDQN